MSSWEKDCVAYLLMIRTVTVEEEGGMPMEGAECGGSK